MSNYETDRQYEIATLEKCTVDESHACVTTTGGISLGFDVSPDFTAPEPGCKVRVYPNLRLGSSHRGVTFENPDGTWRVGYYLTADQAEDRDDKRMEELRRKVDEARRAPIPPTGHAKYEWRPGMGEISGMGGAYEGACRQMVAAGCQYLDDNPEGELKFGAGITAESDTAKGLEDAILEACPDCSYAMMGAATNACLYVRKNGWDAYCNAMTEREVAKVQS